MSTKNQLEDERLPIIAEYVTGAFAGMVGTVVGQPLDSVKVQQQISATRLTAFNALRIVHSKGWKRGYFRGMAMPLLSQGAINSLMFGSYGWTLRTLGGLPGREKGVHYTDIFLAGCVAGISQLVVCVPTDVVKLVLQGQISTGKSGSSSEFYSGTRECLRRLYAVGGLAAFYRGFWLQVSRDVFSAGAYFLAYEYGFDRLSAAGWTSHGGVLASIAAGGVAGMISWFVILPIDVIKSQVQAAATQTGANRVTAKQCLRSTYAQGGVRAFFAGCTPLLVRAFLTNSVIFVVYHQTLRHMTPFYFRFAPAMTPEVKGSSTQSQSVPY